MQDFTQLREGFTSWLLTTLQDAWSGLVNIFGIVIQDPVPIAIGLAASVFVVLIGLIVGRAIFRYMDSKLPPEDEAEYDDEFDAEFDDEAVDSTTERNEIFER